MLWKDEGTIVCKKSNSCSPFKEGEMDTEGGLLGHFADGGEV